MTAVRALLVLAGTGAAAGAAALAASAAGFGPFTSDLVAAGTQAIQPCDVDGLTVTYTTVGGDVVSATVGDVADPGCEGGELSLTLTDAGDASIASGSQTVAADGDSSPNSVSVSLGPQPAAEVVAGYRIVVTGP